MIETKVQEYDEVAKALRGGLEAYNGNQLGGPVKAAEIIVDIVRREGVAKGEGKSQLVVSGPEFCDES